MQNQVISGNLNTTLLLNYLKTAIVLYPSLSKKEEKNLINKYRNDRETLNKLLFMHNIKLVFNIAKKYMSKTLDFDGMVQDGMIGLGEAAKRFDIDKDIKFCTYAHIWIRKYILANFYGKLVDVDKHCTSLNSPALIANMKSNNGNEITFENYVNEYIDPSYTTVKTIDEQFSSSEQINICKDLIANLNSDNSLSSTDKEIFTNLIYNKDKPKELAEKYNKSVQDIMSIKINVLSKFKKILEDKYHINDIRDIIY